MRISKFYKFDPKNSPNFLSSPYLHTRKFIGNELLIITFCKIGWLFRNPTTKNYGKGSNKRNQRT